MAKYAFIQHRLGRTDGVSLEVDKWRSVLESRGHKVFYIAGNHDVPGGIFIPELYPFHPVTARIIRNATRQLVDYDSPRELMMEIESHANLIQRKLDEILDQIQPDVILPNNLLSVGYNLPGLIALSHIIEKRKLPTICHCHDFWWEDSGEVYPTCPEVVEIYKRYAPPSFPWIKFVTINRLAQKELKTRKDLDSLVVPNVFDFNQPLWKGDEYNKDIRDAWGIDACDLLFLQATRVLDRKAIELAIDVVARLNQPENRRHLEGTLYDGREFKSNNRVVLVCAGYVEGIGLTASYGVNLQKRADRQGVKLIWAGDRVAHSRGDNEKGEKIYSLWDSYVHADFVTYPSIWEGWGNQFIEAVFARLPVVLFEYPVWVSDLSAKGFDVVSLGKTLGPQDDLGLVTVPEKRILQAVDEILPLLKNSKRRAEAVNHNFQIARESFSYEALSGMVDQLINDLQENRDE